MPLPREGGAAASNGDNASKYIHSSDDEGGDAKAAKARRLSPPVVGITAGDIVRLPDIESMLTAVRSGFEQAVGGHIQRSMLQLHTAHEDRTNKVADNVAHNSKRIDEQGGRVYALEASMLDLRAALAVAESSQPAAGAVSSGGGAKQQQDVRTATRLAC